MLSLKELLKDIDKVTVEEIYHAQRKFNLLIYDCLIELQTILQTFDIPQLKKLKKSLRENEKTGNTDDEEILKLVNEITKRVNIEMKEDIKSRYRKHKRNKRELMNK